MWDPGIQTQVLRLSQPALYPLNYPPALATAFLKTEVPMLQSRDTENPVSSTLYSGLSTETESEGEYRREEGRKKKISTPAVLLNFLTL